MKNKRMFYLGEYGKLDFYRYKPSLTRPYFSDYPKAAHPPYEKRWVHKIRMMTEYLRGGYDVFYIVRDNDVLGHIVVAPGGRRVKLSKKDDIVVGPIYISPSERGKGVGTAAIRVVLDELGLKYSYAYEFIAADNVASLRTAEKNGYILVGRAKERGVMKNLVESPNGDYLIYRYAKK